jgi:DASS family divalent anion:Na+ symporter
MLAGQRRTRPRGRGEAGTAMNLGKFDWIAWLLVMAAPIGTFSYLTSLGAERHPAIFAAIAATALLMWLFSLLPDFVPALMALLGILVFGLAPESVVLSGFSSNAFLLAFSILGLGAVVVQSGLTRRYSLVLLANLPANTFAHQLSVFLTGLIFTPTVPSIAGRAAIVGPVVSQISQGWDQQTRRRSSTMLYTTGLDSIHYMAPFFLTAAPANLMIYALLPPQEQQAFHFVFWLFAGSVTAAGMLIPYFLVSAFLFRRSYKRVALPKAQVREELAKLGRMTNSEWAALLGIILLGAGIVAAPWHRIEIHYVALAVLCQLLVLGVLSRGDFVGKIDWAFLMLLGSLIGVLATLDHLQIDTFLMGQLTWLGTYMRQDFALFVMALSGVFLLARLVIPLNQAIVIFAAALIPIASNSGIAPWVVGFVLLVLAETAFFPHQSPYIFLFNRLTSDVAVSNRRVQLFHLLLVPFKLLAIYLSIPFWEEIGVL